MIRKRIFLGMLMLAITLNSFGTNFTFLTVGSITNGINDTTHLGTNGTTLNAVAAGNGGFVAVGTNSITLNVNTNLTAGLLQFLLSTNAGGFLINSAAWTNISVSTAHKYNLKAVAFGANTFVASGSSNILFTSTGSSPWVNDGHGLKDSSSVDVEGLDYNPSPGVFALVSGYYEAAFTTTPTVPDWTVSHPANTAIVESFRGVTSMGTNGFALCGINGDIRLSFDGAQTWNQNQIFNFSLSNLLAIASDYTTNRLVAAGDNGFLEVSTNGGVLWAKQTSFFNTNNASMAGTVTNNLNSFKALAYLPGDGAGQFIATDIHGDIFVASNNVATDLWQWYQQTPDYNVSLNGIAYGGATNGVPNFLTGIILLVGGQGTVILGGTPPLEPVLTGATNCAQGGESCPNEPIAATLFGGAATNYVTLDWFDSTQTNYLMSTVTNFIPPNTTVGTYTYYARPRDVRTGFTNGFVPVQFKVDPLPDPPVAMASVITNVLTGLYQTNGMLAVTVSSSLAAIQASDPLATVTADWYTDSNGVYMAGTLLPDQAFGATNSVDPNWLLGGGVVEATNTTTFIPTNRVCGTYTYWVRARVINPTFTNCICQSTNLTPVVFVLVPPAPFNPVNGTNCALANQFGGCMNPTLSVTVLTNFDNPANTLSANWYDSFGNLLANSTLTFTPLDTWPAGIYTYYVEATNAASGLASTNRIPVTLTVDPLPLAPVVPNVTNAITGLYQTNLSLVADVSASASLIAGIPGATVTVDWYSANVNQLSFIEAQAAGYAVVGGVNNYDTALGWAAGNNLLVATNTLVFHPTNRVCGTYIYYARARVINPNFANCICQSTNLTVVMFTLVPPAPGNPMNGTNCLLENQFGECMNPTLSVTVLTNFDNPANTFSVNWYDSLGNVVTNISFAFTPTNSWPAGAFTYYVETTNPLTGFVSAIRTPVTLNLDALPLAPVVANVTNILTGIYQTNLSLVADVSGSTNLIATNTPGATVTVDWYTANVNQMSFADAQAGGYAAEGGVTNYDTASGWAAGNNLLVATNTLIFHPTNRLCGTYVYYARARVLNPNFTGCICQSTNLTPVTFTLDPAPPVSGFGATNCVSSITKFLSVTLFTNADNLSNSFTADWYDANGNELTNSTLTFFPTNTTPTNFTVFVFERDINNQLVSPTPLPLIYQLNPIPTIVSLNSGAGEITATKSSFGSHNSAITSLVTNSDGSIVQLGITFSGSSTVKMSVTYQLQLTGTPPWSVIWSQYGEADTNGDGMTVPASVTKIYNSPNTNYTVNYNISQKASVTNFVVSAILTNDSLCPCEASNMVTVEVNLNPQVDLSLAGDTNFDNQLTVCSGVTVSNVVNLISGEGTWIIAWDDGLMQTNADPSTPIIRPVTNSTDGPSLETNYWVTSLLVKNSEGVYTTNSFTTNDTDVNEITVNPIPTDAPTNSGPVYTNLIYSCYNVSTPMSVNVDAGFTADWWVLTTNGLVLVATNTTTYVPPIPVSLGAGTSVTNNYFVFARYPDADPVYGCLSSALTNMVVSTNCNEVYTFTNLLSGSGSNQFLISWQGNYILQGTTNLLPPNWMNLSTGFPTAPIIYTNTYATTNIPAMFFRLEAPTN